MQQPNEQPKVNLNLASIEELISLPGIGRVTAKRIIYYRQRHGRFKHIEDLLGLGLGKSWFEQVKHRLEV